MFSGGRFGDLVREDAVDPEETSFKRHRWTQGRLRHGRLAVRLDTSHAFPFLIYRVS
jgi:hypothetical protein